MSRETVELTVIPDLAIHEERGFLVTFASHTRVECLDLTFGGLIAWERAKSSEQGDGIVVEGHNVRWGRRTSDEEACEHEWVLMPITRFPPPPEVRAHLEGRSGLPKYSLK